MSLDETIMSFEKRVQIMSFDKFVSIGFDEEGLPLFDTQEQMESNFQEWFGQSVNEMKEEDEYFFGQIDDLDKWIDENKWDDLNDEQNQELQNNLDNLKKMMDGHQVELYEWSLEYDRNVMVVFKD